VTEQVAWHIEPRIFSCRSTQKLFSLKTVFRGKLNLAWYQQVPSLLTGIGLLLTFVALLVDLSKLHATVTALPEFKASATASPKISDIDRRAHLRNRLYPDRKAAHVSLILSPSAVHPLDRWPVPKKNARTDS